MEAVEYRFDGERADIWLPHAGHLVLISYSEDGGYVETRSVCRKARQRAKNRHFVSMGTNKL